MNWFDEDEFMMGDECVYQYMDTTLLDMLDDARDYADTEFWITSSYRTPEYNLKVGGVEGSAHTKGRAVDIRADNGSKLFKIVWGALDAGFERIGIGPGFVHLDNDLTKPHPVIWTYNKQPE